MGSDANEILNIKLPRSLLWVLQVQLACSEKARTNTEGRPLYGYQNEVPWWQGTLSVVLVGVYIWRKIG